MLELFVTGKGISVHVFIEVTKECCCLGQDRCCSISYRATCTLDTVYEAVLPAIRLNGNAADLEGVDVALAYMYAGTIQGRSLFRSAQVLVWELP